VSRLDLRIRPVTGGFVWRYSVRWVYRIGTSPHQQRFHSGEVCSVWSFLIFATCQGQLVDYEDGKVLAKRYFIPEKRLLARLVWGKWESASIDKCVGCPGKMNGGEVRLAVQDSSLIMGTV
jgi:hypothetical protein